MNIKKENCEECKNLPEGEVVAGHDHRQFPEEELEPVTKDSLIEGILKMYYGDAFGIQVAISQIKKFAEDKRINWK
jgi:hypothetical protein